MIRGEVVNWGLKPYFGLKTRKNLSKQFIQFIPNSVTLKQLIPEDIITLSYIWLDSRTRLYLIVIEI